MARVGPPAGAGDQGGRAPLVGPLFRGARVPGPEPGAVPLVQLRRARGGAAARGGARGRPVAAGGDHAGRRPADRADRCRAGLPGRPGHHAVQGLLRPDRDRRRPGRPRRRGVRRPGRAAHPAGRAHRHRRPGRAELADRELPGLPRRGVRRAADRPGAAASSQVRGRGADHADRGRPGRVRLGPPGSVRGRQRDRRAHDHPGDRGDLPAASGARPGQPDRARGVLRIRAHRGLGLPGTRCLHRRRGELGRAGRRLPVPARQVGDAPGPRALAGKFDVVLPDQADRRRAEHLRADVHRGHRGDRRGSPGEPDAAEHRDGRHGNSRRPVAVLVYRGSAADRLAGWSGSAGFPGFRDSRARPVGRRRAAARLGTRPDAVSPGDQRARRVRGRRRAVGVGQTGGFGRRGRRAGRHAGPSVSGEEMSALPAEPQQLSCSVEELRTLFLFEKLSDDQLQWLCERGHVELIEPGTVYAEGAPATCFYVLLEGTVVLSRRVGADDIEVGRTSTRGVYTGAFMAYLGESVPQVYNNSVRVTEPSRFFVLDAAAFAQLMQDWFPMAVHLLEGLFFGNKNAQAAIGQRERLLALGSLSAGLTHELNNPAAAAVRATSALRERVAGMRHKLGMIASGKWDRTTLETLIKLQEEAAERVPKAVALSPLEASDREDAISDWLEDRGCTEGWMLAPTFVAAGLDVAWLDHIEATVDPETLEPALRWLNYTVDTELLMNEIEDSTTRISTLVGAAKQYSQLDRAPYQVVDVHELLDSTLMMLSGKIPPGIQIVKEYDRSLPQIPAYAAELNQVWTNLIDNAVSAMNGTGTLTVRTGKAREDEVFVEFGDTGPGVRPEIKNRIFEPFFTTKPVGEGTGLGLDISWRIVVKKHHGDLSLESSPGDTRFRVRLPVTWQDTEES